MRHFLALAAIGAALLGGCTSRRSRRVCSS
jgi:hypothetical protein